MVRKSGRRRCVLASRDTPARTFRKSDSKRPRKAVSEKQTIFVHFPKDRNCEVRKRTKIARAFCRKRTGDATLRAENFGDLMTNHEVFSEGCESQNNHRYAVVVQDVASQWIPSHPCKNKNFVGYGKEFTKVFRAVEKSKVIYTEFWRIWKIL